MDNGSKKTAQMLDDDLHSVDGITGNYRIDDGSVFDGIFEGLRCKNTSIEYGSFSCSTFKNCIFEDVEFISVCLDFVTFEKCSFSNVAFIKCAIEKMKFQNCENSLIQFSS